MERRTVTRRKRMYLKGPIKEVLNKITAFAEEGWEEFSVGNFFVEVSKRELESEEELQARINRDDNRKQKAWLSEVRVYKKLHEQFKDIDLSTIPS